MNITRRSPMSGEHFTYDLPVTQAQMDRFDARADLIQNIFPELSVQQREFIKSGYSYEEQARLFAPPARTVAEITVHARMVEEGSWGARDLGQAKHQSTMALMQHADGRHSIEWDIPSLEEFVDIGLTFDEGKNLTDYDGTMSLPKEAIGLLRDNGFHVSEEFE